jgi:hypothetical protein
LATLKGMCQPVLCGRSNLLQIPTDYPPRYISTYPAGVKKSTNCFWYRTLVLNFFEIQKIIFLTASSLLVLSWELLILWCSWINWNQQFSYLDFLSSKNQNQWLFDSANFKEPKPSVV